jgi:DnaJ domain
MSSTDYRPRFGYDIRINPDPPPRRPESTRPCAVPGCREPGESNVPKHRDNLEDRQWLCREHLREHNAGWNYFAGMMPNEIEHYCREAVTGHRPTWPLGKRAPRSRESGRSESGWTYRFEDGFVIFEEAAKPAARAAPRRQVTKSQVEALAALNLEETASLHEIKARYKELVKRFHPDANGGNRGTEERLRQVIKAYGHLRATGFA